MAPALVFADGYGGAAGGNNCLQNSDFENSDFENNDFENNGLANNV